MARPLVYRPPVARGAPSMSSTRQAARVLVAGLQPRKGSTLLVREANATGSDGRGARQRHAPPVQSGALSIEAARGRHESRHAHALPHTQCQGGWSVKAHIIGWGAWHRPRSMVYTQPGRARVRGHGRARRAERRKIDEKIALRARASRSRYAARAARSAVCIVAIRVARERSKKLRRRPQGAGRCKHSAHERKRL